MARSILNQIALVRRILLSICAAHVGLTLGWLLWFAAHTSPEYWTAADFTSIITQRGFDFASTFRYLLAVIYFSRCAPFILITLLAQLKVLLFCIVGKRWNCMLLALFLSFIAIHWLGASCFYVGDPMPFGWAFRR